jgi:hypothetical protein
MVQKENRETFMGLQEKQIGKFDICFYLCLANYTSSMENPVFEVTEAI